MIQITMEDNMTGQWLDDTMEKLRAAAVTKLGVVAKEAAKMADETSGGKVHPEVMTYERENKVELTVAKPDEMAVAKKQATMKRVWQKLPDILKRET